MNCNKFTERIFDSSNPDDFDTLALELFRYQAKAGKVYNAYLDLLQTDVKRVSAVSEIPFLPIEFFKTHEVKSGEWTAEAIFYSSGTTGQAASRHFVRDTALYERSLMNGFKRTYGDPRNYLFICLLPASGNDKRSSLLHMTDKLIEASDNEQSGYYFGKEDKISGLMSRAAATGKKALLFGVSYALLDAVERHDFIPSEQMLIMETGGMKGRRKEMVRAALHNSLKAGFGVGVIHSEYGMTELMSQAYSRGEGVFIPPPWMQVRVRDVNDPFDRMPEGRSGGLNIIDLANIHSCAFIATQDLGIVYEGGSFEVLGRFDHSEARGCNLMVADL